MLAGRNTRVCLLHFGDDTEVVRQLLSGWYPAEVIEQDADPAGGVSALDAYFAGDLEALDRIDVEFTGTPFQKRVWEALRLVRAGRTASYADLARTIGHPNAGKCRRRGERRQSRRRDQSPATASSARTAPSPVTAVASSANAGCSNTRDAG